MLAFDRGHVQLYEVPFPTHFPKNSTSPTRPSSWDLFAGIGRCDERGRQEASGKELSCPSGFGVFPDYFWRLLGLPPIASWSDIRKSAPLSAMGQSERYELRVRTHATQEVEGVLNRLTSDVRPARQDNQSPPDDLPESYMAPRRSSRKFTLTESGRWEVYLYSESPTLPVAP